VSANCDTHAIQSTLDRLARELDVDVRSGLAAVLGRTDRYMQLMGRLVTDHASDMDSLHEKLALGDRASAIRIVHGLKGAAATLGATRLAAQAREVEMLLRQENAPQADTLAHATELVHNELLALAAVLPSPVSSQATPPVASVAPATAELLDTLAARLSTGDFAAQEIYHANQAGIAAALGPAAPAFANAMSRFDFFMALETLCAARAQA